MLFLVVVHVAHEVHEVREAFVLKIGLVLVGNFVVAHEDHEVHEVYVVHGDVHDDVHALPLHMVVFPRNMVMVALVVFLILVVPLVVYQILVVPLVVYQILVVPLVVYRNMEVPLVVFYDDVLVHDGVLVVPLVAFRILVVPLVVFHDDALVHDGVLVVRSEYNDVLLILFHYVVALVGMEDALDQKTVTQVQIVVLVRNVVLVL